MDASSNSYIKKAYPYKVELKTFCKKFEKIPIYEYSEKGELDPNLFTMINTEDSIIYVKEPNNKEDVIKSCAVIDNKAETIVFGAINSARIKYTMDN